MSREVTRDGSRVALLRRVNHRRASCSLAISLWLVAPASGERDPDAVGAAGVRVPGDRDAAIARGDRRPVHRTSADPPAIAVHKYIRLAGARDPDVTDLVVRAIAIDDDRSAGGRRRRGTAAVTHAIVDHRARRDRVADQRGPQRHRASIARGVATVEPEGPDGAGLAHHRDKAMLGGGTVVVQPTQPLPRHAAIARACGDGVVGVILSTGRFRPGRDQGTVATLGDHRNVGPVGDDRRALADGHRRRPDAAAPAGEAEAMSVAARLEPARDDTAGAGVEVRGERAGLRRRIDRDRRHPWLPTRFATSGHEEQDKEATSHHQDVARAE